MAYANGQLTSSTAYWNGAAYKAQRNGFNIFGQSTGETYTIPAAEGVLAGTYTFNHIYTASTGLPLKDVYPGQGGLPAETTLWTYKSVFNLPGGFGGLNGYANDIGYDAYGRVDQLNLGGSPPNQAFVTSIYDPHTGRINQRLVTRLGDTSPTGFVDKQSYTYDLAGNLTKQQSARSSAATAQETQCFQYDKLRRLTQAWTATDDCATTPAPGDRTMVGSELGAASAYWTNWTFDNVGNRTNQTRYHLTGGPDTTTTYTYDGAGAHQPSTLTSTATAGATTGGTSYRYDANGNMTSRDADHGNQHLTWNDANQLVSVAGSTAGISTFIYDADGNLLLQKDPDTTTLYLPGQQHALNLATQAVTGTRYYPLPGGVAAVRTGSGTNYTFAIGDHHQTPTLYLDHTAQLPTWRQYSPYGEPRGATVTAPDNRGFLNKPLNHATGLTQVGARNYDTATGRFISVDPIMDPTDPQQWNAYAYAHNSPTTNSDPSGLKDCGDNECRQTSSRLPGGGRHTTKPVLQTSGSTEDEEEDNEKTIVLKDGTEITPGKNGVWVNGTFYRAPDLTRIKFTEGERARCAMLGMNDATCAYVNGRISAEEHLAFLAGLQTTEGYQMMEDFIDVVLNKVSMAGPLRGRGGAVAAGRSWLSPYAKGELAKQWSIAAALGRGETIIGKEVDLIFTVNGRAVTVRADALARTRAGDYVYIEAKYSPAASYTTNQSVVIPELVRAGDSGMVATIGARSGDLRRGQQIRVTFQGDVWSGGPTLHGG